MKYKTNPAIIVRTIPDFDGLIDQDILDRFKDCGVPTGGIINAQLIKNTSRLIQLMETKDE